MFDPTTLMVETVYTPSILIAPKMVTSSVMFNSDETSPSTVKVLVSSSLLRTRTFLSNLTFPNVEAPSLGILSKTLMRVFPYCKLTLSIVYSLLFALLDEVIISSFSLT